MHTYVFTLALLCGRRSLTNSQQSNEIVLSAGTAVADISMYIHAHARICICIFICLRKRISYVNGYFCMYMCMAHVYMCTFKYPQPPVNPITTVRTWPEHGPRSIVSYKAWPATRHLWAIPNKVSLKYKTSFQITNEIQMLMSRNS